MALEMPQSASAIAEVAAQAGQLGVGVDDVAEFTRTMVMLGDTTNIVAVEAATQLARFSNIMGTVTSDIPRLGATIVDLGNNSATTEAEIVDFALRLAAAGKTAGLSESDILAYSAALSSVGVQAERGGSALSKTFYAIDDAVKTGGDQLAVFADIAGVSAADFQKAYGEDSAKAISMFVAGLGNITDAGGSTTAVLEELELTDTRLRAALSAAAAAGGLLNDSIDRGSIAWAANTALVKEAETRYDTTAAKTEIAKNALNDVAITIGDDLLPMLASMAEGVAKVAGVFGSMPDPVRQVTTGIVGVSSVAALAAGSFLMLFPRVMETHKAFKTLSRDNAGLASGLKGVGTGAGVAAVAYLALVAAASGMDAIYTSDQSIAEVTAGLLALGDATAEAESYVDMPLWQNMGQAFDNLRRQTTGASGAIVGLQDVLTFGQGSKLTGLDALKKKFDELGQALAVIYASDPELATDRFNAILEETGGTSEYLLEIMPAYADALNNASNESVIAASSTKDLTAATEEETAATEAATAALDEWRTMAQAADAQFINLTNAYDSVIQANTDYAQSTADATESADDSWTDYYDGQTVSAADYIAQLQAQVDAQTNWEANMLAITERTRDGMTGNMATAARGMIDELLTLGPDGAAQVALLAEMSDAEFEAVVTLWSNQGAAAVSEFTTAIESARKPKVTPVIDFMPANAALAAWARQQNSNVPLSVMVRRAGGFADGGSISGPGTATSDSIPIMASDGEYMESAAAHSFWGTSLMDALNQRDVSGVLASMSAKGFAGGGAVSGGHINTSSSMSNITNRTGDTWNIFEQSDPSATAQNVARRFAMMGA